MQQRCAKCVRFGMMNRLILPNPNTKTFPSSLSMRLGALGRIRKISTVSQRKPFVNFPFFDLEKTEGINVNQN